MSRLEICNFKNQCQFGLDLDLHDGDQLEMKAAGGESREEPMNTKREKFKPTPVTFCSAG